MLKIDFRFNESRFARRLELAFSAEHRYRNVVTFACAVHKTCMCCHLSIDICRNGRIE